MSDATAHAALHTVCTRHALNCMASYTRILMSELISLIGGRFARELKQSRRLRRANVIVSSQQP
jgi:hypothetical protein